MVNQLCLFEVSAVSGGLLRFQGATQKFGFLKRHIVSAQKELRGLHQSEASREAALLRRIGVLREMEKYLEKFPRHSISPLVSPSSTSTISEEENLRNNENMLIDEDDDGLIDGEYGSIRVC